MRHLLSAIVIPASSVTKKVGRLEQQFILHHLNSKLIIGNGRTTNGIIRDAPQDGLIEFSTITVILVLRAIKW
jgi:hypothetical protein